MGPSGGIVLVLGTYLLALLVLGFWGSRESHSLVGYYVAGKKLPSWVIAFSSTSTGESAWLLLGLTGMGYMVGFHALWVVLGEFLGVLVAWKFVARPFKEYTDRYDSITVMDYLETRFGDHEHIFRLVGTIIILSMVTAYTAAQLTASGKAFNSFLGMDYATGVTVGAVVILFYTTVGGFKAVAYSDLLQGILMFCCLFLLPVAGIMAVGGWDSFIENLHLQDPALLTVMGSEGLELSSVLSAVGFVAIGFAFLGSPQLLTRFMAARSQVDIVQGSRIAIPCILVFDIGAVLAGMSGRVLFPSLADPETVLPVMSVELFPSLITGLFLVTVLAAIMSTVDSLLILASASVVRDVIQQTLKLAIVERKLSLVGKLVTVLIGTVALVAALMEMRAIFWFVLFAWSGIAAAFTPAIICSLFWDKTTKAGAIAGMISGFLATVLWVLFFKEKFFDLYEMIPGFIVGFMVVIAVSLCGQPPLGAKEEMVSISAEARKKLAQL